MNDNTSKPKSVQRYLLAKLIIILSTLRVYFCARRRAQKGVKVVVIIQQPEHTVRVVRCSTRQGVDRAYTYLN